MVGLIIIHWAYYKLTLSHVFMKRTVAWLWKEEYILCNDISKCKTTYIVGSKGEITMSYLKTKKKGMQKIEQKTEEKYGVDKRLCNATHEWHLEPFFFHFLIYFCFYNTVLIFLLFLQHSQANAGFYTITKDNAISIVNSIVIFANRVTYNNLTKWLLTINIAGSSNIGVAFWHFTMLQCMHDVSMYSIDFA